jgi:hypothetical protein
MRVSRIGSGKLPVILAALAATLAPARIGRQDLASLIARQPAVSERARQHLLASSFGTIHAAIFTFPHPMGSWIPEPIGYRLASLDLRDPDATFSIPEHAFRDPRDHDRDRVFPQVDRTLKGNRLVPAQHKPAEQRGIQPPPAPEPDGGYTLAGVTTAPAELPSVPDGKVIIPDDLADSDVMILDDDESQTDRTARAYFGIEPMGGLLGSLQPWGPGETPVFETPGGAASSSGETIAGKGEVTGGDRHPMSPAERLGLTGKARQKAEKCLADAVYFEARGESVRGQIAVAQVVMNRVFSGYYPENVCGVVYQNARRHLACQFTFACDGIPERVNEPDAWERAKHIARDTLDGKLWLTDVGKATHYHAYWVHPWWVRTMRKLDRIGVHTFYRPRRWGDGADQPVWGDAATTAEAAKHL